MKPIVFWEVRLAHKIRRVFCKLLGHKFITHDYDGRAVGIKKKASTYGGLPPTTEQIDIPFCYKIQRCKRCGLVLEKEFKKEMIFI